MNTKPVVMIIFLFGFIYIMGFFIVRFQFTTNFETHGKSIRYMNANLIKPVYILYVPMFRIEPIVTDTDYWCYESSKGVRQIFEALDNIPTGSSKTVRINMKNQ